MFGKYSVKTVLILWLYSSILFIAMGCVSKKNIRHIIYTGTSDCGTAKGLYIRDFDVYFQKDTIKVWRVELKKGTRYKFVVFEHSIYTSRVKKTKSLNSIISVYYENDDNKIEDENFINSTLNDENSPNCFIFDCKESADYLVAIQLMAKENKDRRDRSTGVLYYLERIE